MLGRAIALLAGIMLAAANLSADTAVGRVTLELNATQSTETGCLLSFLITNGLSADISSLILETVLLDTGGQVERLTLFDFGALPSQRPRVRQFALEGRTCSEFGAVLINGAQTCAVAGEAPASCDALLDLASRVEMDLLG